MTESRIEIIDDYFWLATFSGVSRELPREEDFEQLRRVVSANMS